MSYEIDSSKRLRPQNGVQTQATDTASTASNSQTNSVKVFQQSLPENEKKSNNFADIDVNELVKKYKKNPIGVLNELGINFDKKQIEELKSILTDKKQLKSFLNLLKDNEALTAGDIVGAMKNIANHKAQPWYKRFINVGKTLFKEGVSEAFELAKSEKVYYAGKLGENMNDVRTERQDFSSEAVVDVSETMTNQPETKENVMHFVIKSNKDGSKLYTEQDVLKARDIIVQDIDNADEFTANTIELEAIQTANGNIKYKGSTIIDVGDKMTKNQEVKSTMLTVAKKSDMTDDLLINTTTNLAKNHNMAEVIEYLVTAKDKNGNDRFSAQNVSNESNYLVDKMKEFCKAYTENVKEIASHSEIKGDDVLNITHNTTEHPEIKQDVLKAIKEKKYTSKQISDYSDKLAQRVKKHKENTETGSYQNNTIQNSLTDKTDTTNENKYESENVTTPIENVYDRENIYKKLMSKKETKIEDIPTGAALTYAQADIVYAAVIDGKVYDRGLVLHALTKRFGSSAEKVLIAIERDPSFIDLMKHYNGNPVIINALVEDPYLITKIKKAGGSLGINEIADIVKLCTDARSTEVMLQALQNYSPAEAMKITKQSKIFNLKDDTINILTKNNSSTTSKKSQLEDLYFTGGKQRELLA